MGGEATDEELMRAVAGGDPGAFDTLCRRWERPLHAFLARAGAGRDVDDLYQDTWLRVVRAAPRFDPRKRFSTWLFQIALNRCRDWHRRPPPTPVDPASLAPHAHGRDTSAATEAGLDARRLLATLPAAQREVVVLRLHHGFGEAETAEILGCPPGTVKSRLHYALARLLALAAPGEAP